MFCLLYHQVMLFKTICTFGKDYNGDIVLVIIIKMHLALKNKTDSFNVMKWNTVVNEDF